jgi:hypothetical protein
VNWDCGARLRVTVDAVDATAGVAADGAASGARALNGLQLSLQLRDARGFDVPTTGKVVPVPQVGPGRYELAVDVTESPAVATLRLAGSLVASAAVAARYPAEYDGIGNDRRAMRELTARTGGTLVEPGDRRPLPIPPARGVTSLTSPLAAAAAACLALALVWWRAT